MKPKTLDLAIGAVAALLSFLALADMFAAATAEQIKMSCLYGRAHLFSGQNLSDAETARLRGWMIFLACDAPPETKE